MTGFDQIVGHQETLLPLRRALEEGKPAHAYLFLGPQGVGKSTAALAFVQTLLCRQPGADLDGLLACGTCSACQRVASGNHPDLMRVEMEAEKTRIVVDQIRELNRFIALTPLESPWKVVLLDDAAQMNEAAANALLKTLEEPPANAILLLITQRAGGLLPTILSRCRKVRFAPLETEPLARLVNRLNGVDLASAREAAALAGGSVARALALCDPALPELRRTFQEDLASVRVDHLADLIAAAERWSDKEKFPTAMVFLQAWFRERIHANLNASVDRARAESLLELAGWAEQLRQRAALFNLNRQLVMEALFIRVAGWHGVS